MAAYKRLKRSGASPKRQASKSPGRGSKSPRRYTKAFVGMKKSAHSHQHMVLRDLKERLKKHYGWSEAEWNKNLHWIKEEYTNVQLPKPKSVMRKSKGGSKELPRFKNKELQKMFE
jgi:hypothetical protein